jgi:hypothetical protein
LETRTPSPQLLELVRAEPSLVHRLTILRFAPPCECVDRVGRRRCRRSGSTP